MNYQLIMPTVSNAVSEVKTILRTFLNLMKLILLQHINLRYINLLLADTSISRLTNN